MSSFARGIKPELSLSLPLSSSFSSSSSSSGGGDRLHFQHGLLPSHTPAMAGKNSSTQLIDRAGIFNVHGVEAFVEAINLVGCGLSYAVVSIMGPQSSGKSTLLNHLFHTNFREMNAARGRSQTTQGIWLARGVGIDPCTIVMDLEGSDGNERGEDGAFEKQSALFALAVSDILLINMWNHNIGLCRAGSMPLLRTVLQAMTHLIKGRKTTLLFVIRDISKTPLEELERTLRDNIEKIWDSVPKAGAYWEAPFGDFFNVHVVGLPNYEEKEEQFKEQVARLRQRFYHSIAPGGLAGDRREVVPAAGFSVSLQEFWKKIKENKDLNVPADRVMVAAYSCGEIARKKLTGFSKEWHHLEKAVQPGLVPHFGQKLSLLLDKCLSGYNEESQFFDDGVRTEKRMQLELNLLQSAYPVYKSMLSHLRSKTLDDFKEAFDKALQRERFAVAERHCTQSLMSVFDDHCKGAVIEQAKWDRLKKKYRKVREKINRDIDAYKDSVWKRELVKVSVSIPVALGLGGTAAAVSIAVPAAAPVLVPAATAVAPAAAAAVSAIVDHFWVHK